jgi:hypothetical protein
LFPPAVPAGYTDPRFHRSRVGSMRAEIEAAANEIRRSLSLLRRHL